MKGGRWGRASEVNVSCSCLNFSHSGNSMPGVHGTGTMAEVQADRS